MKDTVFIPYGIYLDILNTIGQWKIIDLKSLLNFCNYKIQYKNLSRKVCTLEKNGLIKSIRLSRGIKHVYLSKKGGMFTPYDKIYEISDSNLNHDTFVGVALRKLLEQKEFLQGEMFNESEAQDIAPDAMLLGEKNEKNYNLALEIELTQKEKKRIKRKFVKYANSENYNYALFLTNKLGLFNTYQRYLSESNQAVQNKIIIAFYKNLNQGLLELDDGVYYFKGEMKTYSEIFKNTNGEQFAKRCERERGDSVIWQQS